MNNIIIPKGEKHVDSTKFQGNAYYNTIGMYYLSHKHDDICVIFNEPYEKDITITAHWLDEGDHEHNDACVLLPKSLNMIPLNQTDVSLRWIQTNNGGYISVPKPEYKFWQNFNKCSNKRFVVTPFGYNCLDSGHANYLLYDKQHKSLERFEAYGEVDTSCLNNPEIDKSIEAIFKKNLGNDFILKYKKPLDFLPKNNLQTLQENENEMKKDDPVGFCSVWSLWYIDLRLLNPSIPSKKLIELASSSLKKMKKENGISLTQFIRNYSNWIVEVSLEIESLYRKTH